MAKFGWYITMALPSYGKIFAADYQPTPATKTDVVAVAIDNIILFAIFLPPLLPHLRHFLAWVNNLWLKWLPKSILLSTAELLRPAPALVVATITTSSRVSPISGHFSASRLLDFFGHHPRPLPRHLLCWIVPVSTLASPPSAFPMMGIWPAPSGLFAHVRIHLPCLFFVAHQPASCLYACSSPWPNPSQLNLVVLLGPSQLSLTRSNSAQLTPWFVFSPFSSIFQMFLPFWDSLH